MCLCVCEGGGGSIGVHRIAQPAYDSCVGYRCVFFTPGNLPHALTQAVMTAGQLKRTLQHNPSRCPPTPPQAHAQTRTRTPRSLQRKFISAHVPCLPPLVPAGTLPAQAVTELTTMAEARHKQTGGQTGGRSGVVSCTHQPAHPLRLLTRTGFSHRGHNPKASPLKLPGVTSAGWSAAIVKPSPPQLAILSATAAPPTGMMLHQLGDLNKCDEREGCWVRAIG
jgi:hypothetical protein